MPMDRDMFSCLLHTKVITKIDTIWLCKWSITSRKISIPKNVMIAFYCTIGIINEIGIWYFWFLECNFHIHVQQNNPWNIHAHRVVLYFVITLRPRQNGRLFADDTFKRIFVTENIRISIKISLTFVPKGLINNIPALVHIMARHRTGDRPLSEPMMVRSLTHICVTRPQWVIDLTHVRQNYFCSASEVALNDMAKIHNSDVIMSTMESQITSFTSVYSTVYLGVCQRKYQSSASLAFVRGIHRWPVNSPHKGPVTRKMFPFDDVIMNHTNQLDTHHITTIKQNTTKPSVNSVDSLTIIV